MWGYAPELWHSLAGNVVDKLTEKGLMKNTLILFTGDK